MRLWHPLLIPYLPKKQLISQWRECIAIKRQWEKGTLKHRLVNYVMDYDKLYFLSYLYDITQVMQIRNIKYNKKYVHEIEEFCGGNKTGMLEYHEHNTRYLKQCLYNLQEKADRNILTPEEWSKIHDNFKEYL